MSSVIGNYLSWMVLWWHAKYPESVINGYQVNLQTVLNTRLPKPILNFCYKQLASGRKGLKKVKIHGIGIHSQKEIIESGKSDLRILSDVLCDKPFIFKNEITLLDVVAFANLAQLHFISKEVEHPLRDAMNESFPNLVGPVQERAFPDWEEVVAPPAAAVPLPKAAKEKMNKEIKDKKGTGPAEKPPLNDETEKGKGYKEQEENKKEPEEK